MKGRLSLEAFKFQKKIIIALTISVLSSRAISCYSAKVNVFLFVMSFYPERHCKNCMYMIYFSTKSGSLIFYGS